MGIVTSGNGDLSIIKYLRCGDMRRMITLGLRLERSLSNVSVSAVSDIAEVKEIPGRDKTMNKAKR